MSGHSKWSTIKRKKAAEDEKRGKIFSRLSREITVAAKEGGGDPDTNPRLRTAIETAKAENMPNDNIERAIKRGTGDLPGQSIEEMVYEGYGPGGVAILVKTATDNTNRTVSEIRKTFENHGGNLGEANSVAYMFRQVGYFLVDADTIDEDDLLLLALDAGAEDVTVDGGKYEVTCAPTDFLHVKEEFDNHGIDRESEELTMLPNSYMTLEGREADRCLSLLEALEDHDDVQGVYSNLDFDAEVVQAAAAG